MKYIIKIKTDSNNIITHLMLKNGEEISKSNIINQMKNLHIEYYTITGSKIHYVPTSEPKFITTNPNNTTIDNLSVLPTY